MICVDFVWVYHGLEEFCGSQGGVRREYEDDLDLGLFGKVFVRVYTM
jgi:hypothetical protein